MTHSEAVNFIKKGISSEPGIWLDLGAGSGTFTLALAELLPPGSTIYAIDKDEKVLNISSPNPSVKIITMQSEFEHLPDFPKLDGIFMANALHYVEMPIPFLQNLLKKLRTNGSFLIIEYNMDQSNPWVPFPILFEKWKEISSAVSLSNPEKFNERTSLYGRGTMYGAISYFQTKIEPIR